MKSINQELKDLIFYIPNAQIINNSVQVNVLQELNSSVLDSVWIWIADC